MPFRKKTQGAKMNPVATAEVPVSSDPQVAAIQARLQGEIETLLASLPDAAKLTAAERRSLIARYTSVLEGNFIYWMTGAYIALGTDEARAKIMDNLHEEVRDAHPAMLRRFALAAHAAPTDTDAAAVYDNLSKMRAFIGKLQPVPVVVTMAFFEGFIQRFMPYLADLAKRQGSSDMEYTDVHGVCDITHTAELYEAVGAELALVKQPIPEHQMYEGVGLLRGLIQNIVAV
jgi:hypothetical protein